jgi:hypothetical protein
MNECLTMRACNATARPEGNAEFTTDSDLVGVYKFIELSALNSVGAGWLVNDTLVLTVEVTVEREDRFQLDTGKFFLRRPYATSRTLGWFQGERLCA